MKRRVDIIDAALLEIPEEYRDAVWRHIGWYNVPHPTESDEPLTSKYEFTPSMPGADMTYYAVFHQEQVTMDMEINRCCKSFH